MRKLFVFSVFTALSLMGCRPTVADDADGEMPQDSMEEGGYDENGAPLNDSDEGSSYNTDF